MKKAKHHIFVCGSFRANGTPQGVCSKKESMQLLQYLEQELSDRGLSDVLVSGTGCLKVCDRGPAMVVYPENWWYGGVEGTSEIDDILDALEEGRPAEKYILT
ncbi:MAG TPA: (2Fe-2S) ferredoxin domain-containing protein [Syntrophorhabdaceae bacterium]|jgi:(2Fe-2S) ferredoxin